MRTDFFFTRLHFAFEEDKLQVAAGDDENVTISGRKSSGSKLLRFIVNSFEFAIFHVAAK